MLKLVKSDVAKLRENGIFICSVISKDKDFYVENDNVSNNFGLLNEFLAKGTDVFSCEEVRGRQITHIDVCKNINFMNVDGCSNLKSKVIKLPKKDVDADWIIKRMSTIKDVDYKNLSDTFKNILKGNSGVSIYSASYGVGISCLFNKKMDSDIKTIENFLNEKGIKFRTEFSQAHWVYRFVIGKSKENIEKINKL